MCWTLYHDMCIYMCVLYIYSCVYKCWTLYIKYVDEINQLIRNFVK